MKLDLIYYSAFFFLFSIVGFFDCGFPPLLPLDSLFTAFFIAWIPVSHIGKYTFFSKINVLFTCRIFVSIVL